MECGRLHCAPTSTNENGNQEGEGEGGWYEWKGYADFGLEEATTLRMQQGEGETDKVF